MFAFGLLKEVNTYTFRTADYMLSSAQDYRAGSFKRNLGLRIDHIWTTERLAARTTGAAIDAAPRSWERPSDHAPVIVEMMNEK